MLCFLFLSFVEESAHLLQHDTHAHAHFFIHEKPVQLVKTTMVDDILVIRCCCYCLLLFYCDKFLLLVLFFFYFGELHMFTYCTNLSFLLCTVRVKILITFSFTVSETVGIKPGYVKLVTVCPYDVFTHPVD